jgi:cell division protein FtsI/penicillin-binding protein 2
MIRRFAALAPLAVVALLPLAAGSLSAGSFDRAIDRDFPQAGLSYLLLDVNSREVIATRWPDASRAISTGSLVKPFLMLAAIEAGAAPADLYCGGSKDRCWRPSGHGTLTLPLALAHSCNGIFLKRAARIPAPDLERICSRYGLPEPGDDTPETRIGLGANWNIPPRALATAYLELLSRRDDPGVRQALDGLRNAARLGTAQGLGAAALAKTGTAPCANEQKRHAGDGFSLAMFPPEAPRYLLLVRVHGVPGAASAKVAGGIVRLVQNGGRRR